MTSASGCTKYQNMYDIDSWGKVNPRDAKIMALTVQLEKMEKLQATAQAQATTSANTRNASNAGNAGQAEKLEPLTNGVLSRVQKPSRKMERPGTGVLSTSILVDISMVCMFFINHQSMSTGRP